MGLTLNHEQHVYTYDGEGVPGVTDVLQETGILPTYDHLVPYHAKRGQRIHEAICWDLKMGVDLGQVDADIVHYVQRFRRFAESVDLEPELVEQSLFCPVFRYAGTVDFAGKLNGQNWLLDWKRQTVEPGHAVQIAGGYAPLVEQHHGDGRLFRVGVVTLGTEIPKLHEVAPFDERTHRDTFRAALAVYRWRQAHMKGQRA